MTPELGIIEGYFGKAWNHRERTLVIDTLCPAGYRFFHYAPKSDSYLRREWRAPYPAAEWANLQGLARHCAHRGMRFGIGLTPFGAHLDFGMATRNALAEKLRAFDALGLDDLAILFDDMRGDTSDLAQRQSEIVAFCLDHSLAKRFFVCPSYYSNDPVLDQVFGIRPNRYLEDFGRKIDPRVSIYWTGEQVCSKGFSVGHLRQIAEQLGRKVCLWDNYPVNDGPTMSNYLHLHGFTGRPAQIAEWITGHAINPALQPMLGCIPALTLIDVYRERDDYSYHQSFYRAAERVCGRPLADQLREDLLVVQGRGLDRLGDKTEALRARYAAIDHRAAREIVNWLDRDYVIDSETLQTQ